MHYLMSSFPNGKCCPILIIFQLWVFLELFSSFSAELNGRCAERCKTHRPKDTDKAYTLDCLHEYQDNNLDLEECADDCNYCDPKICNEENDPYVFMCPGVNDDGSSASITTGKVDTDDDLIYDLGFSNAYVSNDILIIIVVLFVLCIVGGSIWYWVWKGKRRQQIIQGDSNGQEVPGSVNRMSVQKSGPSIQSKSRAGSQVSNVSYATSAQSLEV